MRAHVRFVELLMMLVAGLCVADGSAHAVQYVSGQLDTPDELHWSDAVVVQAHVTLPARESFTDLNHDGVWSPGEPFNDWDGNGAYSDTLRLTIAPGTAVECAYGQGMTVSGQIQADGFAISMTGQYIYLQSGSTGWIRNSTLNFNGYGSSFYHGGMKLSGTAVVIENNDIVGTADCQNGALEVSSGSPVIRNNRISGYTTYPYSSGIRVSGGSPILEGNELFGNCFGFVVSGGSPDFVSGSVHDNSYCGYVHAGMRPDLSSLTFANNAHAGMLATDGSITGSNTWDFSPTSAYYVLSTIDVAAGGSLTIPSGTTVDFANKALTVNGAIHADDVTFSMTGNYIYLQAGSTGWIRNSTLNFNGYGSSYYYGGVRLSGTEVAVESNDIVGTTNCSNGALEVLSGSPVIRNNRISGFSGATDLYHFGSGLTVSGGSPIIEGNELYGNQYGFVVNGGSPTFVSGSVHNNGYLGYVAAGLRPDLSSLTFASNTKAVIVTDGTVTGNNTWDFSPTSAYYIRSSMAIAAEGSLTIPSGTTVDFANKALTVNGAIHADDVTFSMTGNYIYLQAGSTGWIRNSRLNFNGYGSSYYYGGVRFDGTGAVVENNDIVGTTYCRNGALEVTSGSPVIMSNRISGYIHPSGSGIKVIGGSPIVANCSFSSVATAIAVSGTSSATVANSNLCGATYGINNTGTGAVLAQNNWWGAASGPRHATNPGGTGSQVSDRVDFTPWLESPASGSWPAYEIVSAMAAQRHYQNGTGAVTLNVSIKNNWGPTAPSLTVELFAPQVFRATVTTMTATLPIGQTTVLPLTFLAPAAGMNIEYDADFIVNGAHYSYPEVFTGTESSDDAIAQQEQRVLECLPPGQSCSLAVVGLVPFAGAVGDAVSIVAGACDITSAAETGDVLRGAVGAVNVALATFSAVTDYIMPPIGNVASFVASGMQAAIDCSFEGIRGTLGGAKAGAANADPLAQALFRSLNAIGAPYANQIVIDGPARIRIRNGGTFTGADSLGVKRVAVVEVDSTQYSWAYVGIGPVPLGVDSATNPLNVVLGEIQAASAGQLDVALLHRNASGVIQYVAYDPFDVTSMTVCRLALDDSVTNLGIQIDYDNNGTVDHIVYPEVPVADAGGMAPVATGRTALFDAYPNPCNPQAKIAFEAVPGSTIRLTIHDVAGHHVRTLVDGRVNGLGRQESTWDGRDSVGRAVAAGVYFYRLESSDFRQTKRLVLLK